MDLTQKELNNLFYQFHTANGYVDGQSSTKKNYDPDIWGPPAWKFIDYVILHYPKRPNRADQVRMVNFVMSLGNILPCEKCRKNYNSFMKDYPPLHNVSSRSDLERWFSTYKRVHK